MKINLLLNCLSLGCVGLGPRSNSSVVLTLLVRRTLLIACRTTDKNIYDPQNAIAIKFHLATTFCDELVTKLVGQSNCTERKVRSELASLAVKFFYVLVSHGGRAAKLTVTAKLKACTKTYVLTTLSHRSWSCVASPLDSISFLPKSPIAKKVTHASG